MKVAIVFVLLFATVLCRPVEKVSVSSSASSEEVVKAEVPAAPTEVYASATPASSDESTTSSDEDAQPTADPTTSSDSDSKDSEDSDDDDETEESESEEDDDDSSQSSESGESSTPVPATVTPVMVTEEPVAETTVEPVVETTMDPIVPTIVTDSGRGDSMGGYPSDYKSIIYVEDKSYQKLPSPYKSYEFVGAGKKMAYDMTDGNEVEKQLTVYKALQVHSDLEEDTSTPDVEIQGLDASQDQDFSHRQATLPEESISTTDATTTDTSTSDGSSSDGSSSDATSESESTSAPEEEEEEEESASTASDSTSTESEDEESSEEATATPGAADSDSDESESSESDSDEDKVAPAPTTDMPAVITAK